MSGEHPNGGMTEVESHYIDFIEINFPNISDTSKHLDLYELEELKDLISSPMVSEGDLQPSGNEPSSGSVPLELQDSQVCKSERGHIPRRHFEIERDVFMCSPIDEEEPTSIKEALSSSTGNEWLDDEMSSLAQTKVWE